MSQEKSQTSTIAIVTGGSRGIGRSTVGKPCEARRTYALYLPFAP